jgi:catechol-2,3-dioxygenase
MKPAFLDHLVIVVKNIEETERFYNTFLGQPTEKTNDQIIYEIDNIKLFFVSPLESWQSFNKDAGGLNHLAFGIKTKEELENFKDILDTNKIKKQRYTN